MNKKDIYKKICKMSDDEVVNYYNLLTKNIGIRIGKKLGVDK